LQSFAYYKGNVSNPIHPKNHGGLITTTGYACATYCAIAGMPAIYDWVVKAPSTCARTPVYVRSCGTLPVDFIWINALKASSYNKISWSIALTKSYGRFTLEKSSDGHSF